MTMNYFQEKIEVHEASILDTTDGSLVVASGIGDGSRAFFQTLPPFAEIMRRGKGYTVQTSTAFAPLVAIPTTTAALEVYNNTPGTLLVVLDLFHLQLLGTAAQQSATIFAMVTTQKAVPSLTALNLTSMSGKPAIAPTAAGQIVTGVGTTVVANGWRPYGTGAWGLGTATPGPGYSAPIDGKLIVPYGCSLCVHVVNTLATASSEQAGATFAIVPMDSVA